jgi:hypothetical protein
MRDTGRRGINQGRAVQYDQSWMGYGIVGGIQAGLISAAAGLVLFVFFHWLGRRNGWGYGPQIGWSFLLASSLTVSGPVIAVAQGKAGRSARSAKHRSARLV